jgi:iron(III) transport system substrate-binding protein
MRKTGRANVPPKRLRLFSVGALALAGLVGLAACSSGSETSSSTPTASSASAAASPATSAASAGSASAGSASAGSGSASADGTAGESVPAASGTVVVYSGRNETLVKPLLDQFTADTGIAYEFRGAGSGELAAQIITEGDASPADVFFSQDAGALGAVQEAGLFAPISAATLSRVPAAFSSADGLWLGVSGRARVIVYNPTLAPNPPDTIEGLLDPEWQGKIGFAPTNASWQAFVTGLRVLLGEDGAREWLVAFAAQDPKPYESNGAVRDAVNAGEIALGLINHYYLYEKQAAEGGEAVVAENQFMAAGDPGGLLNVAGVGVLATAPNPDGAQALAEYLVSDKAQQYFAESTKEYPLAPGVNAAPEIPPLESLEPPAIDLSDLATLEQTQELLAEVGLLTQ